MAKYSLATSTVAQLGMATTSPIITSADALLGRAASRWRAGTTPTRRRCLVDDVEVVDIGSVVTLRTTGSASAMVCVGHQRDGHRPHERKDRIVEVGGGQRRGQRHFVSLF